MSALSLNPDPKWILLRQLAFVTLCAGTLCVICQRMYIMLQTNGFNALKAAMFILFLVLLSPIVLSFWTAALGFLVRWRGGDSLGLTGAATEGCAAGARLALHGGGGSDLQRGPRPGVCRFKGHL